MTKLNVTHSSKPVSTFALCIKYKCALRFGILDTRTHTQYESETHFKDLDSINLFTRLAINLSFGKCFGHKWNFGKYLDK